MKRALICGVSGQDGAYLAKFLLGNGYEVFLSLAGLIEDLSYLGIGHTCPPFPVAFRTNSLSQMCLTQTSLFRATALGVKPASR